MVAIILVELISKIQLASWFLIFHLTYYNVAHRISILTSLIVEQFSSVYQSDSNESIKFPLVVNRTGRIQTLQEIGYLMNQLAIATNQLQSVFSFPVLLALTTSSLSCTICLFVFIRELFKPTSVHASIYLQLILVCIQVTIVLTVVLSADLPTEKVRNAILNQPFVLYFSGLSNYIQNFKTGETFPGTSNAIFYPTRGFG